MLADFVVETCATTGTGTFSLGGAQGNYKRFRDKMLTGARVLYVAKTVSGSPTQKFEYGRGVLTTGTPDTLTRATVFGSSNSGSKVDWQSTDTYWIYSAPILDAMVPLPADWIDTTTSGRTITGLDKGAIIECDVSAADRAVVLPLGSGITDEHFRFGVYGYGSTSNNVVLTPNAADYINEGAVSVVKNVAGGVLTFVYWDPVKSKWRTK